MKTGGVRIRRIKKTAFPAKFTKKGSLRYIAVPSSVEERMGLQDGDFLDVVITWPIYEEYDLEDRDNVFKGENDETI